MQDFISNGNGDSRYLKSVSDFLTRYPTYEDMAAALVAGTLPVDFNGYNPNGISQRGTPYNKANVLTDATAALLGLTGSATPNDAFAALAEGAGSTGGTGNYFGICTTSASDPKKTVSIDGFELKQGAKVSIYFNGEANTAASPELNVNGTGSYQICTTNSTTVLLKDSWIRQSVYEFVFYNRKWFMTNVNRFKTYIEDGSYAGKGTYGASNPNTIELQISNPILIYISRWSGTVPETPEICVLNGSVSPWGFSLYGGSTNMINTSYSTSNGVTSVSFYSSKNAGAQMNTQNMNYYWVAFSDHVQA